MIRQVVNSAKANAPYENLFSMHLPLPLRREKYALTQDGARLLQSAQSRLGGRGSEYTQEKLAKRLGITAASLNEALSGATATCDWDLPLLCSLLGVPFYRTQPLEPQAARLLDALDRLVAGAPGKVDDIVGTFEMLVSGALNK